MTEIAGNGVAAPRGRGEPPVAADQLPEPEDRRIMSRNRVGVMSGQDERFAGNEQAHWCEGGRPMCAARRCGGWAGVMVWGVLPLVAEVVPATTTAAPPVFESQTIDDQLEIGYGLVPADVDGDGRPDIVLADKTRFVWYRNPDWKKFVLAERLTVHDNVCVAARDIDGDGKAELAVGANWNPSDTVDSGSVHYLVAPADRTQPWQAVKLHHEPTVHRMHWVQVDRQQYVLVVSPLHGRGNRNGEGAGARLLAYSIPKDVRQPWPTTLLDDSMHMTHNLDPCQWYAGTPAEELLYIGREGALLLYLDNGKWKKMVLERVEGGGEIRMVVLAGGRRAVATIEPMHGDRLVLYVSDQRGDAAPGTPVSFVERVLLDDNFQGGHAIAAGDLVANPGQEIVAGWRLPNRDGKVGLKLYWAVDPDGRQWESCWLDENGMATEDARLADLDGDGRLDVIAAGRATKNLKIYWNRSQP
ncbi:MAG: hypothetical protein KatS3mg110_4622 [Pirellulaceae bacterium]|nr:MAG: hypothetical protein KatS3mg110_4622 [Pirellulaceae bacterium]